MEEEVNIVDKKKPVFSSEFAYVIGMIAVALGFAFGFKLFMLSCSHIFRRNVFMCGLDFLFLPHLHFTRGL